MTIYILFTRHGDGEVVLLSVYRKSHYQAAYDRIADIADRHGDKVHPGAGNVAIATHCRQTGQVWYVERHECE